MSEMYQEKKPTNMALKWPFQKTHSVHMETELLADILYYENVLKGIK